MRGKRCKLIINLRNGYCLCSSIHDSISSAIRYARESCGFAYRIYDIDGKRLLRNGFC